MRPPDFDKIPPELKTRPQWVLWKKEIRDSKPTKIPYRPHAPKRKAEADNPATWGPYEVALRISQNDDFAGVGYEFSADDPFAGVDLDHCRDPETGIIEPWAQEIIRRLNSFTEVSPSGCGVHVILKGKLPPGPRRKGKVEMYDSGRYFTMTGQHLEETPTTIEDRQTELETLHKEIFREKEAQALTTISTPVVPLSLADSEIIARARAAKNMGAKFDRLMSGDISGYNSHSEADYKLCWFLAFWTKDRAQIDRIFRTSELCQEPGRIKKWNRVGMKTIENAIKDNPETYQGRGFNKGNGQRSRSAGTATASEDPKREDKPEFTEAELLNFARDGQVGDARLFIRLFKGQFCYDHAAGLWYEWGGHFWVEDDLEAVLMALDHVIDIYEKQALHCGLKKTRATREDDKEAAKRAEYEEGIFLKKIIQLQRENYRRDVLHLTVAGRGSLGITGREWDRETCLIACPNGIYDLKAGIFRPGRPDDYIKTACPTEWRGLIEPALEWDKFLDSVFDGDQELISYVKRLIGYSISGQRRERLLPIFTGIGMNGKGTTCETTKNVLGDLAGPVPAEILLEESQHNKRTGGAPTPEIMDLRGKRLVWASETNEGRRLNAGKAKLLSGGDTMVGRGMYAKKMVRFTPTHTIFLMTNHKPKADPDDFALWGGRLNIVPFDLSFVDNPDPAKPNERKRDAGLLEKLKREVSGILAWMVQGFDEYQKRGLDPPDRVLLATEQYRQDQDTVGQFIEERCIVAPGAQVQAGEFYQEYKKWCEENGYKPIWGNKFAERVGKRFRKDETNKARFYFGVGIRE
jgi:putative DNA primase/helicase